ncbi:MAG: FHIPEP family type III secretion protein [Ferruginibacter sp.]|nr:FHIPEP family type III secretion protein [Ferruginibacter sp.]
MYPVLKIQIGTYNSTKKEISKDELDTIIWDMLYTLGVTTAFEITLTDKIDFLTVNEHRCEFPASLVDEVTAYTLYLDKLNPETGKYWELLISNILWLQPQVLFPDECLTGYLPVLNSSSGEDHNEIKTLYKEIIAELLSLKISIADNSRIIEISNKYLRSSPIEWNDLREELIEALSGPEIAVFFHPDYFEHIIKARGRENLFELMRDGLFYETGIKYPPFRLYFDKQLPLNAFYFKINSFTSIPCVGLLENEVLVNDTPDRLSLIGIAGRAAINPANGNKCTIIESLNKKSAENARFTTWDSFGYFILGFSSFLRKYGYSCVDKKLIVQNLKTLKLTFPKVGECIEKFNLLAVSVKTLRLLAKDGISIRNLQFILQAIVDSDYIIANGHTHIIFEERIPVRQSEKTGWKSKAENIVEFVRARLKKSISYKYTSGQSTLIVYLLDPDIEIMIDPAISGRENPDDENCKKINEAVQNEIVNLPPASQVPVILTTVNVRPHIKKIIEFNYPQIAVLSYHELSPEMNIQPIARISFP